MEELIFHPVVSPFPPHSLYKGKITPKGFIYLKIQKDREAQHLNDVWNYFEKETKEEITPSFLSSFIKELSELYQIENIVTGLLIGDNMYLAREGDITCFLYRKGKYGPILASGPVSYGKVEREDHLFVSAKESGNEMGKTEIEKLLTDGDLGKSVEGIFIKIASAPSPELVKSSDEPTKLQESNKKNSRLSFPSLQKIKGKTSIIFSNMKEKILFNSKNEELDPSKIRKRKILFFISVILTLILIASLFITIRETRNKQREKLLNATIKTVQQEFEEASNLASLNPPHARELLATAKQEISSLLTQFPKDSYEYKKAQEWFVKISDEESLAYKIYKLSDVPLFFDITFIKPEGEGKVISVFEDTAAILDTKNQVIYTLTLDKKQAKLIAGSDTVKDAKGITIYGKNIYIANSDGLVSINVTSGKSTVVTPHDEKWGDIQAVSAYGANVYLLDTTNNMIWKYVAAENGFNPISTYLNSDTQVDFSDAFSMVIDGNVWVLSEKGIYKFTRGIEENFTYKEFSDSIASYGGLSAVEENTNLYVLDKSLSRIIVFNKEGIYQAQYQWENFKNANEIYASEKDKKIYVIIGSKIYAVEIR